MARVHVVAVALNVNCVACGTSQTEPREGSYMWDPAQLTGTMVCQNNGCSKKLELEAPKLAWIER